MNTTFQAALVEDWVMDAPCAGTLGVPVPMGVERMTSPYDDGVADFLDNLPCTQFRHYATAEEWYDYTRGYVEAKQGADEAEDYENDMADRDWHAKGAW